LQKIIGREGHNYWIRIGLATSRFGRVVKYMGFPRESLNLSRIVLFLKTNHNFVKNVQLKIVNSTF